MGAGVTRYGPALVGSPDTVIRKIQEQHDLIGHDILCTQHGFGRLAPELLHDSVPTATLIALLLNPTNPHTETISRDLQAAARILGLQLHVLHASSEREFDAVFATATRLQAAGLVIGSDIFFNSQIDKIADLAVRHALPTVYQLREFAAAGGLLSYGSSVIDGYVHCGIYTVRILKGEKPVDLPVIQSSKFEFVINLNTAKAFGLSFP